jgi:hypothetical protein
MQRRLPVAVVAVGLLAACTSGSGGRHPSSPSSSQVRLPTALATNTPHCRALAAAADRVARAEAQLYTSAGKGSLDALRSELHSLQAGAPANVQAALAQLATGFTSAQQLLAHPTARNKAQLSALESKLAADAELVSSYVVGKCKGG